MNKRNNKKREKIGMWILIIFICTLLLATPIATVMRATYVKTTSPAVNKGNLFKEDNRDSPPGVTRYVPSQYPTIQAAIDVSDNGDEIVVADGVYTGEGNYNLLLDGKDITIRSVNGPENTIIDCNFNEGGTYYYRRGFTIINGVTRDAVISGFTIINGLAPRHMNVLVNPGGCNPAIIYSGSGELGVSVGGAIFCNNSSPTIENCIFNNNSVAGYSYDDHTTSRGAAIYGQYSAPLIKDCTFGHNICYAHASWYAPTVAFFDLVDNPDYRTEIDCCTFTENHGRAILVYGMSSTITNCRIDKGDGAAIAGIEFFRTNSSVENSAIFEQGAGIHTNYKSNYPMSITVKHCTIRGDDGTGILGTYCIDRNCGCSDDKSDILSLNVYDSTIFDCYNGITWNPRCGSLQIRRSTIQGCNNYGVLITGDTVSSTFTIDQCKITACTVALSINYCQGIVSNSWFVGNTLGISLMYNYDLAITGCTIAGKAALGNGRALYCSGGDSSTVTIENSIMWNDASGTPSSEITTNGATVTATYSDIRGGWCGEGNINLDPKFVGSPQFIGNWNSDNSVYWDAYNGLTTFYDSDGPQIWGGDSLVGKLVRPYVDDYNSYRKEYLIVDNGADYITVRGFFTTNQDGYNNRQYQIFDYHLQWDSSDPNKQSPCVDTGNNTLAVGSYDFEGDLRIIDGNEDSLAIVDMGGDELSMDTCYSFVGDLNDDGVVNAFDIDPFVLALTNPNAYQESYPHSNILRADVNCDGVVNAFDIDPFVQLLTGG